MGPTDPHSEKKSCFLSILCGSLSPSPGSLQQLQLWRGTWMVSSCSSQLSSPVVIAEGAHHLRRFILINKVLWPIRRGLYKVNGFFSDVTWQHSRVGTSYSIVHINMSLGYLQYKIISSIKAGVEYLAKTGRNKILSLLKYSQVRVEASTIFS